jgi:hypothetical protein
MLVRGIERRVWNPKITSRLRACFQQMNSLARWPDWPALVPSQGAREPWASWPPGNEGRGSPRLHGGWPGVAGAIVRGRRPVADPRRCPRLQPQVVRARRRRPRSDPPLVRLNRRHFGERPARAIGVAPPSAGFGCHSGPSPRAIPKVASRTSAPLDKISKPRSQGRGRGRILQCRRSVGAQPCREFVGVTEHDFRAGVPNEEA